MVAPATSANLGPGYDAFGLALALYDEVTCEVTASGLEIEVTGEAAHEVPRDESHLIVSSIRAAFDEMGVAQPGLRLACRNGVPHGRGLGSSSAAVVSGLTIAAALVPDCDWDKAATLRLANRLEGHPDNVAACIFGGFTVAWASGHGGVGAARLDIHPDIRARAFIPAGPLSTHIARALLPETVPHRDAAFNAGRAGLMVAAMTQDPSLLFAATEDRLHQGYRQPAMPSTLALVERLRSIALPAFVSGAGPAVLALAGSGTWPMTSEDDEWLQLELDIDNRGARVVASGPDKE